MVAWTEPAAMPASPLEAFVRDWIDASGGACEQIEPQVYDLLLPSAVLAAGAARDEIVRVAFDPDALPEHPAAQLASLGTPLIDRLLDAARHRARYAEAYLNGLHLARHDLQRQIARAIRLPAGVQVGRPSARALFAAQAVYGFEATFASDQKEQELLEVGIDLPTGRPVRHLDLLVDFARLDEQPAVWLPEARRRSLLAGHAAARQQMLRTVLGLANVRRRELAERVERQVGRMTQYYHDLRTELAAQAAKTHKRGDDAERQAQRRHAIEREEQLRIAELRQKAQLDVQTRLVSVLLVQVPKLFVRLELTVERCEAEAALAVTWDPLLEVVEAVDCPRCASPTYEFARSARGQLACPDCAGQPAPERKR